MFKIRAYQFIACLLTSIFSFSAISRVHDYETTRLKSTAGAGVGAILLDESAILNPAPIAFYNTSSIYLQKTDSKFEGNYISEEVKNRPEKPSSGNYGFILSDANGRLKGAYSYLKQEEGFDKRDRFSGSFSAAVQKNSSLGLTYRYTKDRNTINNIDIEKDTYSQVVIGVSHVVGESFTIGAIVIDPIKEKPEDTRVIIGMQYLYKDFIAVMIDGGSDYNQDLSETALYRMGLQFKFFQGFFVRVGTFNDKGIQEKGNGVGLGWVSPKLVLEGALKNTKPTGFGKSTVSYGESARETSVSLSYYF